MTQLASMTSSSRALWACAVTACLLASACAGPAAATPEAGSVAASASVAPVDTPTPVPTLEATTEAADEAPAGAITIAVGPGPLFAPDQLTAPAGTIVFFLDTQHIDGGFVHNLVIAPEVGDLPLAKSANLVVSQSVIFTVNGLEPGTYEFWCTFPMHLEGGMKGTLTVTP